MALFVLLNLSGIGAAGAAETLLTAVKIVRLALIALLLLHAVRDEHLLPGHTDLASRFRRGRARDLVALYGVEIGATPVEEVSDPALIQRAVLLVSALTLALYLLLAALGRRPRAWPLPRALPRGSEDLGAPYGLRDRPLPRAPGRCHGMRGGGGVDTRSRPSDQGMPVRELIRCRGHPLVLSRHPTTFEVTKEEHLTEAGDCIIGVGADKGAADLSPEFRAALAREGAVVVTTLRCGPLEVEVRAEGHPGLTLDHPTDLVWRRSDFVCGRTIGVRSDYVARTLPRLLIDRLRKGEPLEVELVVL